MEEDDDAIECDDDFPSSSVPAMSSDSLKESSGNMTSDSLNEMQLLAKFKSATDSQDTYKVCWHMYIMIQINEEQIIQEFL